MEIPEGSNVKMTIVMTDEQRQALNAFKEQALGAIAWDQAGKHGHGRELDSALNLIFTQGFEAGKRQGK